MASGQPRGPPGQLGERAVRRLVRSGCGPEPLRLITTYLGETSATGEVWAQRLAAIAEFGAALGGPAARDYFRAVAETKAVRELTEERLLRFARSVDRHTAEWYFWAMWGTGAVAELTGDAVLQAVQFFRSIDSPATVEYFLAVRETGAARELTDARVLTFAEELGSDAAIDYFGAFWETGAVAQLTEPRVLEFARAIGSEAAREYFRTIRETKDLAALTRDDVLQLARSLGEKGALDYFRAIRETRATAPLTDPDVLLFLELIGRAASRQYLRVMASTKAVERLTRAAVLRGSAIIRSIGSDAALDYFLAAADAVGPEAESPPASPGEGGSTADGVPVLTLLDLPKYDRYRPLGMVAASGAFWGYAELGALAPLVAMHGPLGLGLAFGAWAALMVAVYSVVGLLAGHASEQFLARRRRLLNEHGIRWHDCRASGPPCGLCWTAGVRHADARFDLERCCRCPAC